MTDRPNVALLRETLDHVIAVAPEGIWKQSAWLDYDEEMCGTTACFAGWALMLQGGVPRLGVYTDSLSMRYVSADGLDMPDGTYVPADDVADVARKALGLDWDEAGTLFYSDNSLTQLKGIVDHITEGHHG